MMMSALSEDVRQWLTNERCLASNIIKRAQLQMAKNYGKSYLAIPHTKGSLKLRRLDKCDKHEKWQFVGGKQIDIYGLQFWEEQRKEAYLVEAELGCLLLLGYGLNAASPTTGVKSCEACIKQLPHSLETLVLCLDNDDAGRAECKRIAQRERESLKPLKIRYLNWGSRTEKDVTELALTCKKDGTDFLQTLDSLIEDYPLPRETVSSVEHKADEKNMHAALVIQDPFGVLNTPNIVKMNVTTDSVSDNPSSLSVKPSEVWTIEEVLERTRKVGHIDEHVEVAMAAYLSKNLVRKNPIWILIVGAPSSNKTELVSLFRGFQDVVMIDALTGNPFVSGSRETKAEKAFDLLAQLHNSCYIVKEYTSFFSQSEETVKKLLGDMTAIYDGTFTKHSPTRGTITYNASFSHIGCVTPEALRKRQQYMNMIGPRFLMLRYRALSEPERDAALINAWGEGFNENVLAARRAVKEFMTSLREGIKVNAVRPSVPADIQGKIDMLAKFTARTRGIVHTEKDTFKDDEGEEVTHMITADVQIEEPFRAQNQFRALCTGLTIIRGKAEATEAELATLYRVALDSMPQNRADALTVFRTQPTVTAKEAAELLQRHQKTIRRHLDELTTLGVLQKEKEEMESLAGRLTFPSWRYSPVDQFSSIVCGK